MRDRLRGGAEHRPVPSPDLGRHVRAIGRHPHQGGVVGEVDGGAARGRRPDHDGAGDRRPGRGILPPQPHVAVLRVDDGPRVARGRDGRHGQPLGVERVAAAHVAVADVVAQHRAVVARVGEQHAPIVDRDRVGGVLRGVVIVGAERVELRGRAARQAAREHGARVGQVRDVVPRRHHLGRAGGRLLRRLQRLFVEVGGHRLVDARERAEAVAEEVRGIPRLHHLVGIADAADGVELAHRRVHPRVAAAVAGLQRPHGGVDVGGLLRVEPGPDDADPDDRGHDRPGGDEAHDRAATHRGRAARRQPGAAGHQSTPAARSVTTTAPAPTTTPAPIPTTQGTALRPRRAGAEISVSSSRASAATPLPARALRV